ncbi:Similar to Probable cytochrome P450 313a1; acc. no. Q9VFJ0 [Pyronema omphalodes CBS 100304]|uniref:Similar to Probable cytochrome P450 313a1 acc. no. Q9VFJ0 n=1 Tax=Pyronema omphalodes (strain CBS 100304) TaxID=1076935 RepID=U4L3Z7_PYROM|nr:Similar to Probable cytochrome P450 313a1; acc. no. Q9VFJ0 [Pyronema omphalodes CBS 100304]
MEHPLLTLSALLIFLPLLLNTFRLFHNYRLARSTGLPIVVYPFSPSNGLIILLLSLPPIQRLVNRFPQQCADYFNNATFTNHWKVKGRFAMMQGGGGGTMATDGKRQGAFISVSSAKIVVWVTNAEWANEVLNSRNHNMFPKPAKAYEIMKLHGPNILTSEGSEFVHHKKHALPAFGERNNTLVWTESLRQATEMCGTWTSPLDIGSSTLSLALHVLSSAAYGIPMSFSERSEGFHSVLNFVTGNLPMHALATSTFPSWFLKRFLKQHWNAWEDFGGYLRSLIHKARTRERGESERRDLLELLVRGGNNEKEGLTTEELTGNLFIFTVAGHETSAQTLHFALVSLALEQEAQEWAAEGVKEALQGEDEDSGNWKYEEVYPKLARVLCVMLETMRLYPIVPYIPKSTGPLGATLGGIDIPSSVVIVDPTALHRMPEYWGPEADSFDPSRWDVNNEKSYLAANKGQQGLQAYGLEYPTIHKPRRGAYCPFSDGARGCIGRKFAQVTFVAAVATVLKGFKIRVAREDGEDQEAANKRARRALDNSYATVSLRGGGECEVVF